MNHTYVGIYMLYIPRITKTNIRLYSVLNWTVYISVCRRFGLSTFWHVGVLLCRHFGLSTYWSVDVLVCRCFSVCRRFGLSTFAGLSTFRFVDVLTSYLQKGPLKHIKAWLVIKIVIILQTTYLNGFLQ